jgi:hypothetical protein
MKTYVVGGAVRDELLGLPVKDRDWVVVGATPQEMLAQGFLQVGRDFPVFLHPQTPRGIRAGAHRAQDRAGLHRLRCTPPGVTLEDDLLRRDLTINAIAKDEAGTTHRSPRRARRHRGARDAPRLAGLRRGPGAHPARGALRRALRRFSMAPETLALMRDMVAAGEVDALVPERVWQELARGLMEASPRACSTCCANAARWRACCPNSTRCGACRSAPTTIPNRHRRARHDGDRHGGAPRCRAAGALCRADARPGQGRARRPTSCRATTATKRKAWRWSKRSANACACRSIAATWPPGGALPRRHASRRGTAAGNAADPARTLRCAAPPGTLRTDPARLRGGLPRPAGLGERDYAQARRGARRWRRYARSMPGRSRASWRNRAGTARSASPRPWPQRASMPCARSRVLPDRF